MQTLTLEASEPTATLNRIASLLRRRGVEIESLTLSPTQRRGVASVTLIVDVDARGAERLVLGLRKIVPVLSVESRGPHPPPPPGRRGRGGGPTPPRDDPRP